MRAWARVVDGFDIVRDVVAEWDHRFARRVSEFTFLQRFSRVFLTATYLGDGYLWGSVGLGLTLFGRRVDRIYVLIALVITVVNVALSRFIKLMAGRTRPIDAMPRLRSRVIDGYSFPSGHATTSFGLAWVVAVSYPYLGAQVGVYVVASIIAFSRVYVREHFPSDVLAGAALGSLVAAVLFPILSWVLL
jgi:undecaprenyl-diphosphatase